jgi:hypothetical protein
MKSKSASPAWKESSTLEFVGLTLMIPLSVTVFNIILGFVFRGFVPVNPESTQILLFDVLYLCLGTAMAIYVYKVRRTFFIILCSFAVLFVVYLLLMLAYNAASVGAIIENTLAELAWLYAALVSFVFFFRYSEVKLDFAEAISVTEKTEKKTNLKYDTGICTKCGQSTVVAKERTGGGAKKIVFFCDHCGRFIKGNPLTGMVLGIVLASISILFMYGMNAGSERSASAALNFLFGIFLYLGIRSFYLGIRSTYKAIGRKNSHSF